MIWSCASCGTSAHADSERLLLRIGWQVTDRGDQLCPPCAKVGATGDRPRPRPSFGQAAAARRLSSQ